MADVSRDVRWFKVAYGLGLAGALAFVGSGLLAIAGVTASMFASANRALTKRGAWSTPTGR